MKATAAGPEQPRESCGRSPGIRRSAVFVMVLAAAVAIAANGGPAGQIARIDAVTGRLEGPWHRVALGLELAVFEVGQARLKVLRGDPELWETIALAVSDIGGQPRSARQWGEEFGLSAVINAGMFDLDRRTHIGYFRVGRHLNNPIWIQRGYRQVACFEPREPELPRFVLVDLDADIPAELTERYEIVAQNLRLVRKPGENRWPVDTRPWPEACLGEDSQGRFLWIYCRQPHTMHDFVEILLGLPLNLVAAQHLEGGLQAQLWLAQDLLASAGGEQPLALWRAEQLGQPDWPIPNVLGLRPRASDR